MALIVQKFGGTSVGSIECIRQVAEKVIKTREAGHDLVVVVSAMAGETDRLVRLAQELSQLPNPREFDVLLSTGEQVVIALLSLALLERGCPARSYTGTQVHIRTDSAHNKARILGIDGSKILSDLKAGRVVVVAGFQGTDEMGNITTLGRGGSDITAVALAAALDADECQIYTDVDGVYTADPKIVADAGRMSQVTVEEMLEMASNGAKVMQIRAVEFAGKYHVPVRVLSTFQEGTGTLIIADEANMQHSAVSGIAFNQDEAKLVIYGVPNKPGIAAHILGSMSDVHIEVDMIVQTQTEEEKTDLAFTVHKRDFQQALLILENVAKAINAKHITSDAHVAKLSLVGVGMRTHAGVASKMFQVLGKEGINIQLISTSEIKISVIINEQYLERGVRALHDAFQLGTEERKTKEIEQC
ncbi:MAG TPA: aspartate kinase [Gammaproteobacteria bacterium]|nr:aspartate kinase [Gammaproteobacteria bacterium]HQZ88157.1 aspartate kinase [Gammaproteobacteria bacterium]HRA42993.1 aspartate kinase [Gammaproteobacteria bacterium]